jgi:aspartyl-tRNA(Asn)/glutamyl-tRNA(Gln) amidotransferase subunit C
MITYQAWWGIHPRPIPVHPDSRSNFTMSLTLQDIHRIARLARLSITSEEAAGMQVQLNNILGLIEQMQAVDTSGVEPMSHARDVHLRMRADNPTEPNYREKFQAIAPAVENGLYLVPRVIE